MCQFKTLVIFLPVLESKTYYCCCWLLLLCAIPNVKKVPTALFWIASSTRPGVVIAYLARAPSPFPCGTAFCICVETLGECPTPHILPTHHTIPVVQATCQRLYSLLYMHNVSNKNIYNFFQLILQYAIVHTCHALCALFSALFRDILWYRTLARPSVLVL